MKRLLAVTTCLALLFGCAGVKPPKQDTQALRAGLNMWRAFRLEGVATVEYEGLAVHKKAVLRKNDGIIRLDLLESGLFAASPQPFLSVYVDTALVVQSLFMKYAEPMTGEMRALLPDNAWLDRLVAEHGNDIMANRHVEQEGHTITFDARYRIERINLADERGFLAISYGTSGAPSQIELRTNDGKHVLLLVDSFTPGAVDIAPLATPET